MRWVRAWTRGHRAHLRRPWWTRRRHGDLVLWPGSLEDFKGTRPLVVQAPGQHDDKIPQDKEYCVPSPKIIPHALEKEIPLSATKLALMNFKTAVTQALDFYSVAAAGDIPVTSISLS